MSISSIEREDFAQHSFLKRLLELHDIPERLYIKGPLPEVTFDTYGRATPRILAVIGSRKNTTYGKEVVKKLLTSLVGQEVIILSGLALGIDGLSHKEALNNNLITVAVPGSGLDETVLYPHAHIDLSHDILENNGCLISELSPDTKPAQWTFPSRNRIVAALADAILVVEAASKSGALITARLGLELGRDIGAIPGDIFSEQAEGTNLLIKDGAYIIRNEDDLYDLLHLTQETKQHQTVSLSNDEQILFDILSEPHDKDTLLHKSGLGQSHFLVALTSLEMKGYIQDTFGEVKRLV